MPRKSKSKDAPAEELNRKNLLQAVLMADSFTQTFRPISTEQPKVLLPICNVAMIDHTLEWLASNDVYEVFVMCCAHADHVRQYLEDAHIWNVQQTRRTSHVKGGRAHCRHQLPIVHVECIPECTCAGEVLRHIDDKQLITSDPFVLVSGDTVSNMNLTAAVEAHRTRRNQDKSNIMSLVFMPAKTSHPTRQYTDDLVVAIDHNTKQILSFDNNRHCGTFAIGLPLLMEHNQMDFRYDLLDCNIDICSPEVLIHFSDNYDYVDIRRDYVHNEVQNQDLGWKYFAYVIENEYAARVQDLCTYDSISRDMLRRWTYPLVPDSNVNGTTNFKLYGNGVFKEGNVKARRSVKLGPHVIVGSGCVLDEHVQIANATLGRNVKIGKNVRIVNSYIWDDAVIGDNCVVNGAVVCNAAVLRPDCEISPGTVISFAVMLPAGTTTDACSRYTVLDRAKDAFDDDGTEEGVVREEEEEAHDDDEEAKIVAVGSGEANNAPSSRHTTTTAVILARQRDTGTVCGTRLWTLEEWDVDLSEHEHGDHNADGGEESDSDATDDAAAATQAALEEKHKLLKLQHTSIASDHTVKQRRWSTWEGVDLVELGYESESEEEDGDDSVSGESNSFSEPIDSGSGSGKAVANQPTGSTSEAMAVIERMVGHGIKSESSMDMTGVEVRSFMAAQNISMADTGAAVLRGFLAHANEVGVGTKNKIILALNQILSKWTPLLLKFSKTYGEHEQLTNQLRLLHAAEGFVRDRILGVSDGKGPVQAQPHWSLVFPFVVKFLYDHNIVKEDSLRQYKMVREEATPTGAPEDELFNSDPVQQVVNDILDDSNTEDSSSDEDSDEESTTE